MLGVIGKGNLPEPTVASFVEHGAIYFAAIGGLGALLGKTIKAATVVAFDDLGPEAILGLELVSLPAVAIVDAAGRNFHARIETGVARDGELRVRELKRARGASVRANGFQLSKSGGIAVPGVAKEILSKLVLLFEVGGNARLLIGHGRPPSKPPLSASWG